MFDKKRHDIEKEGETVRSTSDHPHRENPHDSLFQQPRKEAVIIDMDKSISARKLCTSPKNTSWDRFDKSLFDLEEGITPPHWAVPWSDIMMVFFVLFAVLFIYSVSKRDVADAFKTPSEIKKVRLEAAYEMTPQKLDEMSRHLMQNIKSDQISVAVDNHQTIKVSASDTLFFDLGKADIKPEAINFLKHFAEVVKNTKTRIRVEGHTDSFPIHSAAFPTNWELSTTRAVNIARFLIEENGIEPERFTVVGHASYKPAVSNDTMDDKAKNRRVEIYVSKE